MALCTRCLPSGRYAVAATSFLSEVLACRKLTARHSSFVLPSDLQGASAACQSFEKIQSLVSLTKNDK